MDKLLRDTFSLLGLSEKEIRFMLSCYHLKSASITSIAKSARLERSTAYLIAQSLREKGLLQSDLRIYNKHIIPVEPKTLLRMLSARQRTVRRQEMELEEKIGELQNFYTTSAIMPKVSIFEGKHALEAVWSDVLSTRNEILLWTNQKTESNFFTEELHEKFIAQRIKKQIPIRVLAVNNTPGKRLLERDEGSLRHSKLLPTHTSFSSETYLYDHKVAMLDYKKDIIGIIIESEAISATQREIFELTWRSRIQ